jgi:hypothetical protein
MGKVSFSHGDEDGDANMLVLVHVARVQGYK